MNQFSLLPINEGHRSRFMILELRGRCGLVLLMLHYLFDL